MTQAPQKTLIIGAGILGIEIAKHLQQLGESVELLEKSKGLGGRLATRRIEDLWFNHGCEKTSRGEDLIQPATENIKKRAEGLLIHRETTAQKLDFDTNNKTWKISCLNDSNFYADRVFITAPAPQALALSRNFLNSSDVEFLENVTYDKTLIAFWKSSSPLKPWSKYSKQLKSYVTMIKLDALKSENLFEMNETEVKNQLQNDFPQAQIIEIKKWRYSQVKSGFSSHAWIKSQTAPLCVWGDWLYKFEDSESWFERQLPSQINLLSLRPRP